MMDFFHGMKYLTVGFRYLGTNGLKRFILMPIFFNLILFCSVFYVLIHYLYPYINEYLTHLPTWLVFLSNMIFFLFLIGFFLIFFLLFTVLCNLVAAPFNGLLAEKVQKIVFHSEIPSISFKDMAIRSFKRQWLFLKYFIPRFLGVGLLFFVPLIHPFYPFIWFFFNAWMLSIQYQDFVMDNNLIGFESTHRQIKEKNWLSLGFGSIINIVSFIPFINILTMPAAVIGSVFLYFDNHKPSHRPLISKP